MLNNLLKRILPGSAGTPAPGTAGTPEKATPVTAELLRDGKLEATAIAAAAAPGPAAITAAGTTPAAAALAIAAGLTNDRTSVPALVGLLARDGLVGRAAGWALGRIGAEAEILAAIASGGLDVRENGYHALAVLAAAGKASPALASALSERVQAEIARAKSGGTGLGEHACRVLAVLGAKETTELVGEVIANDRFCDRFELQRLLKAIADKGRDSETIAALTAPWTTVFADHLAGDPAAEAEAKATAKAQESAKSAATPGKAAAPVAKATSPASKPGAKGPGLSWSMGPATVKPPAAGAPAPQSPAVPPDGADLAAGGVAAEDALPDGEAAPAGPGAKPVDWAAFAASPEHAALKPAEKQLATQLGQLLEKLATQQIRAHLGDLAGQEFAALLLQVLPQALPPQYAQAALSPQALNGYQALMKFLVRTGATSAGDELVQAVKQVREMMRQQLRKAGVLNGPDYSDPDDAPKVQA